MRFLQVAELVVVPKNNLLSAVLLMYMPHRVEFHWTATSVYVHMERKEHMTGVVNKLRYISCKLPSIV